MGSFRWFGHDPSYPVVGRSPVLRPAVQWDVPRASPKPYASTTWGLISQRGTSETYEDENLSSSGRAIFSTVPVYRRLDTPA